MFYFIHGNTELNRSHRIIGDLIRHIHEMDAFSVKIKIIVARELVVFKPKVEGVIF
jgi:hypothetical protein